MKDATVQFVARVPQSATHSEPASTRRAVGIIAGIVTHLLFGFTVWHLFGFLKGTTPAPRTGTLWLDVLLALQFVIPHSILLHPAVRERLTERLIPAAFYGLMFCAVTCLGLLTTIFLWQPAGRIWWILDGLPRTMIDIGFLASWGVLLYSIGLSGFGYQTGWTPWWHWLRRQPIPPRPFRPRSLYRWLRHPVYLSFLGLIWFTPVMTADRAILTGIWTAYVFIGSCLKDRRLLYYLGDRYEDYQSQVPGYPGMLWGPLARIPRKAAPAIVPPAAQRAA